MAQKIIHYDVGDLWTPQATFTVLGTPTDPTTMTVRQQDAAGAETILFTGSTGGLNSASTPVAKTGTGVYKLNPGIALVASGYWFVKFEGTAGVVATEQQQAIVDPDEFTSDAGVATYALVGLSETKDWLRQQNIDTTSDLTLVRAINDVSARFAEVAEREFKLLFGTNPSARTFDIDEQSIWRREISVGDLTSFTQVRIMDELGNVIQTPNLSDVISVPRVRRSWEPIRRLRFTQNVVRLWSGLYPYVVEVTGTWGFPSVPGNVRQAVLDAVVSTMDRDVEDYRTDLAGIPSGGTAVIMRGPGQSILSLPPGAQTVAELYRDMYVG